MMNKAKDLNRSSQQSNGSTPTESPVVRRKLLPLRGSVRAQSLPPTDLDFQSESVRPLPVPPELTKDSRSGARCVLAVFLMLFSAYLGSIFFQGPLLPLIVISPKLFRKLVDFTMASWFLLTEVLIVKLMGIHVRQFGDHFRKPTTKQPCVSLLILNHRTQLDWLFIWGLGDPVHRMKIILKESLSRVPGAGWAMQCAAFLFLRRQLAADQNRLTGVVDYLLRVKSSCQVIDMLIYIASIFLQFFGPGVQKM
ncbi:Lysocardiolipin acyltransferase 1 [Fasciolopsis buskii]|uniref:Lysocardiolipin acyltransferase 1 n=1 Tax=Fasciolopsis buskii TaxID=27845 RepID=A0A8E0RLR9_9TREM|nr:Lysocardiolipin acyltransferase 1 [Fasciolopsis buski]